MGNSASLTLEVRNLEIRLAKLSEEVAKRDALLESMKNALNSCTIMLGHVDAFLTNQHPGWDGGFKERIAKRASDIERYKIILSTLSDQSQGKIERKSNEELTQLADELWAVAGRLGIEANEAPRAASVYLQAENTAGCRRVLRHVVDNSGALIEGVDPNVHQILLRRCEEIESSNPAS